MRIRKWHLARILAIVRQIELSLDSSLDADWEDLQAYYSGLRYRKLRTTIDFLISLNDSGSFSSGSLTSREARWKRRLVGLVNLPLGSAPLQKHQLHFLLSSLTEATALLGASSKPNQETIIENRMKLTECEFLIQDIALGDKGVLQAQAIEHFMNPSFIEHIHLSDFFDGTDQPQV